MAGGVATETQACAANVIAAHNAAIPEECNVRCRVVRSTTLHVVLLKRGKGPEGGHAMKSHTS
jgi:hypothetical protein